MNVPHVIKLPTGELIGLSLLDEKAFNELIRHPLVTSLSQNIIADIKYDAYLLPDGKVACKGSETYSLFECVQDFSLFCTHISAMSTDQEILSHLNLYGKSFPTYTRTLISELCEVSTCVLQKYSNDNIINLEEIVNCIDECICNKLTLLQRWKYLIHFIALVGESLIQEQPEVTWLMKLASDKQTWNPYLTNGNREIMVPAYLSEYLFYHEAKEPLYECIISVKDML